ncbi:MAG: hypothetical protein M3450_10860 [Actinomycetota bacterium]|nr:hypothetical protein [Actinomycetota bacterium]
MTALGGLLTSILVLARELRSGTTDRILQKSDIELGLEYFLRGAGSEQD